LEEIEAKINEKIAFFKNEEIYDKSIVSPFKSKAHFGQKYRLFFGFFINFC
jgi:hypothetical protein